MTDPDAALDGRRLRRDRNREAVVQALLELYREGNLTPSTDEIAERAGISARSLFRYFDDVDALVRTAVARQQEHLAPLYECRPDRSSRCGSGSSGSWPIGPACSTPWARSASWPGPSHRASPRSRPSSAGIRAVLRSQVVDVFGPELAVVPAAEHDGVLAALDVACSWEARHLLRQDQRLGKAAAARVMALSIRRLLDVSG